VSTSYNPTEVEAILRNKQGVGLTLFRAAWHCTKFAMTSAVETYVLERDLVTLVSELGSISTQPTSVILYPTKGPELEGLERVNDLPLVSVPQNFVDLMAFGGQGPRVAMHLTRSYGLLGE